jgi:stage II sporulation protein P
MPHDAGAYERSRRTAANVLRGAAAIFDVHRDAAPPQAYAATVGGRPVTQIMIVVGRANPQAGANMGFAQALKAAADQARPGLMRGILRTGGSFNQDLSSRALLLEVGAHTNRREDAEGAVALLAPVVPAVLGVPGGAPAAGAWRALGVIVVIVVGGGALWLYVATGGSWQAAWDKLRSLGEEFASYLGRRPRR